MRGPSQTDLKKFCSRSGQMLIESLVAMSILTVGFLGIVGLLNQSVGLNKLSQQNFIATSLASEGIEIVKNILDNNYIKRFSGASLLWNEGLLPGTYEADYTSPSLTPLYGAASSEALHYSEVSGYSYELAAFSTPFYRTITIAASNNDYIKVLSTVNYRTRGGAASTTVEDYFYNWRP